MSDRIMAGVINPYALTEVLLGKRVNWRRIRSPIGLVSRTLETPAEDLFDGGRGSPIFALQRALYRRRHDFTLEFGPLGEDPPIPGLDQLDFRRDISIELKKRATEIFLALFTETEHPNATWLDIGDFFEEGTEFSDPIQGAIGDCWLIAALASVAWSRPYAIVQRNRATGPDSNAFVDAIDLQATPTQVVTYEVSEKLPIWNGTTWPVYGRSSEPGEIWPGIYEKVFAKLRTGNQTDKPNFASLHVGSGVDACVRLVPGLSAGGLATQSSSADDLWEALTTNCVSNPGNSSRFVVQRAGRTVNPMTASTYAKASDAPDPIDYGASGIVGWHCYSVLGWLSTRLLGASGRYIVLRNPWGLHEGVVDVADGQWNAYEQTWMRSTPLSSNGVFAMTIESFKRHFAVLSVAS